MPGPVNRITGSQLTTLKACPSMAQIRAVLEPSSKYAEIGTEAHRYYETGIKTDETFLLVPEFKRPEERTFADVKHEWRFMYNFVHKTYKVLPKGNGDRDYSEFPPSEWVCASADGVWFELNELIVEDLKTGAPVNPLCAQLVFIAWVAYNYLRPAGRIALQTLNATRYGYKTDPKAAGVVNLWQADLTPDELEGHFKAMVEEPLAKALALTEAQAQQQAQPGKHCFFAGCKARCEKYRASQKPERLAWLDKLIASQEERDNGQATEGRASGSGDGSNGRHDREAAADGQAPCGAEDIKAGSSAD